jgi:hypothetical protein
MSATQIPNRNFDNEKQEHTPYSVIIQGKLKSSYDSFRAPKKLADNTKKKKPVADLTRVDPTAYRKWFNK